MSRFWDTYSSGYYNQFWNAYSPDIFQECCRWLNENQFPPTLNATNISRLFSFLFYDFFVLLRHCFIRRF